MRMVLFGTAALLCFGGCTPKERHQSDVAQQIEARLSERSASTFAVRTLVQGGADGVVCGYAEEVGGVGFLQPIPFVFSDGAVTLRDNDLEAFNRAQRSCGPGWVSPRDVNGIS